MKIIAAVARDRSGPFALEELDMEEPRDDEVAVRIAGAGICHTDLAQRAGRVPLPVVLGHEGAGIVQSVGTRVSKVSPGDHVVLSFLSCGTCATCQGGMPSYCQNDLACNFAAARLDGSSSLRGRGGVVRSHFFGQSSFGVGAVGLSAVMAARAAGYLTIVGIDTNPARLELATGFGATHVINAAVADPVAEVWAITGTGADYAIEAVGRAEVLRQAVDCLALLGVCGLIGGPPAGTEVTLDMTRILLGRTVRGVLGGDSIPDVFIPHLIELYLSGRFPFDRLITFYPLGEINQAAEDSLRGSVVKPVLRP